MITLRRAQERQCERRRKQEVWHTFDASEREGPLSDGFRGLELLDETRLSPGGVVPRRPDHDAEIVTYVREGGLTYEDSGGPSGVILAGEFQHMITGSGARSRETNASRTEWAHVFQVRLRPGEAGLERVRQQRRFSVAQRRGGLCVVGSPDGRRGSLRIHQGALICSAMLYPGQHVVHELSPGRGAWLHVVEGEVILGDVVLSTGDGVGVAAERALSLTAREESEVLLVDLAAPPPQFPQNGAGA